MKSTTNSNQRVLSTQFLPSTKKSRGVVYVFITVVIFLLLGLSFKIWPITNIVIRPSILFYEDNVRINISLDILEPSLSTLTIPGRILTIGEDSNVLEQQHFLIRKIGGTSVVFSENDLIEVVIQSAKQTLSSDVKILYNSIDISDGYWSGTNSEKLYQGELEVAVGYYYEFPIDNWKQEIIGLTKNEALAVLQPKLGVDKVEITFVPSFMANISQKISSRGQTVKFTLDTDSKTSILE